jgi:hypothetical protein
MWYTDVIMIFLCAILYLPSSIGSLIVALSPKYEKVYVPAMLV